MKNQMKILELKFFKDNFWSEFERFSLNGKLIKTVTCTEDNYLNLYNSQINQNLYGEIFRYNYMDQQNKLK